MDIDDNTLTLNEEKQHYKGSLVVVPTPIGNLGDLSLRQYEALTESDIVACEDTRKTGKLIELMRQKRLKDKFKREFGASFEDFVDEPPPQQQASIPDEAADEAGDEGLLERLEKASASIEAMGEPEGPNGQEMLKQQVAAVLRKLEAEVEQNKFMDVVGPEEAREMALSHLTERDKQFVQEVDQEYYRRVESSDAYYRRKRLILQHLERLQRKVEATAKNFDDFERLRFIMLEKAKQKRSVLRNFVKRETFHEQQREAKEEASGTAEDDFDLLYGLENQYTKDIKDKVSESKRKKGRGLLLSFFEFNQEKRIPRLIRAMKMGFRVALVSDAGTPTISDPGYKFLKEARKQGLSVEALPGPCAATTALSACGFPTERFQFFGYLSKTDTEREEALLEIARSGATTVLYESPNRLLRTLASIEEVFGPQHEVFLGVELTKMHERHIRDEVHRVRQQVEEETEGSRFKGEVTLIIAPHDNAETRESER